MLLLASMLREADADDLLHIAGLEARLFPDNSMSPLMIEREAQVSRFFVLGKPAYAYAIVGDDGTLSDLLRLGVDPDRQGQGAGTRLLNHVVGMGRGVVLTVKKDNHRALRLYKKYGFRIVGHFNAANAWALFREAGSTSCPSSMSCDSPRNHRTG